MSKTPPDSYIAAFAALADITAPKCATCRVPHLCCSEGHCTEAQTFARETFGIELTPHGDVLPFLGESGCSVPPHLRPLCSVHVCGAQLADAGFAERYYELREAAGAELEAIVGMDI